MLITIDVLGEDEDVKVDHDEKERLSIIERRQQLAKEEWIRRQTQTQVVETT